MKKNNRNKGRSRNKEVESFDTYTDCLKELKKSVYMIVRGRKENRKDRSGFRWTTLGSSFLVSPFRLLTAAHVLSDEKKGEYFKHQDGDVYYLLKHDDENKYHYQIFTPKLNKDIFLYPECDLAIIYLNKEFYRSGKTEFLSEDTYIKVSRNFFPIGTEIGVLGYPLSKLTFNNNNLMEPRIGNVLLRTDKGVINSRYRTSEKMFVYEFTLNFNPGNSGGPIFDTRTGKVVSMVKGFKNIDIEYREKLLKEEQRKQFKEYKAPSFIDALSATYSIGLATPSFVDVLEEHSVLIQ